MHTRSTPWALLASVFAAMAMAQTPNAATDKATRAYQIAAQPVATALKALAAQSDMQLIYGEAEVAQARTAGVSGIYTPDEALASILRGTNLQFEITANNVIVIRKLQPSGPGGDYSGAPDSMSAVAIGDGQQDAAPEAPDGGVRTRESSVPSESEPDTAASSVAARAMPEILVKGSRSLNVDIPRSRDDIQPYVILDRTAIERSGASNITDFLKQRLTMNTQAGLPSQGSDVNGNLSRINLRGLGHAQTLILIDGHRTPTVNGAGSPLQSDLNGIPLAAVERIEVLPTTASGIYGGGATGGVINVVLRRDYSGQELRLTYGNAFEGSASTREVSLNAGFTLEGGKTNVMFSGSFTDSDELLLGDRSFVQRGRNVILANNPANLLEAAVPPLGATPNIRSATVVGGVRQNLTFKGSGVSLNSTRTFVPVGYRGVALDGTAGLVANAGQYNLDLSKTAQSQGGGQSLVNGPRIESGMATVRRQFGTRLSAFLEAGGANNTGVFVDNATVGSFTLPATAPNNPFNQSITVRVPVGEADAVREVRNFDRRAVAGVIWDVGRDWKAGADYTWGRSRFTFAQPSALAATSTAAVTSGAIDILRDPDAADVDFSAHLNPRSGTTSPLRTTITDITLRLAGPAVRLPGGNLTLSALLESREEELASGTQRFFPGPLDLVVPTRSQTVDSVYLELKAPLVSARNSRTGLRELELQLAGRLDDYEVNGAPTSVAPNAPVPQARNERSATSPTLGLRYAPLGGLVLRASYGEGFLPPAITQLVQSPRSTQSAASFSATTDPRRGNEALALAVQFDLVGGGNPDLRPENSESVSFGAIFEPTFVPGARLSVDYTRISKTDNITGLSVQQVLDNESLLPGRVERGPVPASDPFGVGRVIFVDTSAVNISHGEVEAYDVQLDLARQTTDWGRFDLFALATWQTHLVTQLLPTTPEVENVGITSDFPLKLKGNAGLNWTYRNWTLGWAARYFHSYRVVSAESAAVAGSVFDAIQTNQGNGGRVPSQAYHDFAGSYRPEVDGSGWASRFLNGVEIKFGINNVFGKRPPFDAFQTVRFYSPYGDPRLANYYLSLTTSF